MTEWLKEHGTLLWWMFGVSVATLVLAVLVLPVLLARMPEDYFVRAAPPREGWRGRHPVLRLILRVARNVLGALLVLVGIPLVPLPGQGIATILAGLALLEFPGKRRLELRVIRMPGVLRAVNWLRGRAGRPPLRLEAEGARGLEAGFRRGADRDRGLRHHGGVEARTFDHGADIGVLGEGRTIEEAFAGAARAMFSVMFDLDGVEPRVAVDVHCTASDRELLLVQWLNALLAEADLSRLVFCDFHVLLRDGGLAGTARGEPFDPARHAIGVEVKGATLTELEVARGEDGLWRAQTVVDV